MKKGLKKFAALLTLICVLMAVLPPAVLSAEEISQLDGAEGEEIAHGVQEHDPDIPYTGEYPSDPEEYEGEISQLDGAEDEEIDPEIQEHDPDIPYTEEYPSDPDEYGEEIPQLDSAEDEEIDPEIQEHDPDIPYTEEYPSDPDEYSIWKRDLNASQNNGDLGIRTGLMNTTEDLIYNDYIEAFVGNDGKFTMGTTGGNPNITSDDNKKLLYGHPSPWSSETLIRVNNEDSIFYATDNIFDLDGTQAISIGMIGDVEIKQILAFEYNSHTQRADNMSIKYVFTNKGVSSKEVGARIMLDTMLGDNDGAPFRVANYGEITKEVEFSEGNIPQNWEAFDDLTSPSVFAMGTFYKTISERPDKVQFAAWPNIRGSSWDYDISPDRHVTGDSAVAVYYNPTMLAPGASKTIVTYYGISAFVDDSSDGDNIGEGQDIDLRLRVTAPSEMITNNIEGGYYSNPFTITAYFVNRGTAALTNADISLNVGSGLLEVQSEKTIHIDSIAPGGTKTVSWFVMARPSPRLTRVGYNIEVRGDNSFHGHQSHQIVLNKSSGKTKLPVIVVHGIFGSTAKKTEISGFHPIRKLTPNMPKQKPAKQSDLSIYDNWAVVPGDTGYADIVEKLKKKGYHAYTCVYDWRLSLEDIVAEKYLQNTINLAKRESGCDKVVIIAHSMGGLVTRQYIQSSGYRNDIEAFFMIGTPNNGSAFTWPILDGGIVVDDDKAKFTDKNKTLVLPDERIVTSGAVYNIIKNILDVMDPGTKATPRNIFDFLRKKVHGKYRVESIVALNSQDTCLLYYNTFGNYYVLRNPYIANSDFPSEIAVLNAGAGDYYQPLTGNKSYSDSTKTRNLVRTAIMYSADIPTISSWYAQETTVYPRFPNGEIVTRNRGKNADAIYGCGDGTVTSGSAVVNSSHHSQQWTKIEMGYEKRHSGLVNYAGELLVNTAFGDFVDLSSDTVRKVKSKAKDGKYKASDMRSAQLFGEDDENNEICPYLSVDVFGDVPFNISAGGETTGSLNDTIVNEIEYSAYTEYDMQTNVIIGEPVEGDFVINISPNGEQKIVINIDYFDGTELFLKRMQLHTGNDCAMPFLINNKGITSVEVPELLTYKTETDTTALKWDAVENAVTYNIYVTKDNENLQFVANVSDNKYISDIDWSDGEDTNKLLYIEPVYADNRIGLLSYASPNYDYAESSFSADVQTGEVGTHVTFTDDSTGVITSWEWDFDSDGVIDSTEQNPTHTYTDDGTFDISLTVSGPAGTAMVTKHGYVEIGKYLTDIEVTTDRTSLTVGETVPITVSANYSDGTSDDVTGDALYVSSDPEIADTNGNVLSAVANGNTLINVFYQNKQVALAFEVGDTVESVYLTPTSITVPLGTEFEDLDLPLNAYVEMESGNIFEKQIMWNDYVEEDFYDPDTVGQYTLRGIVDIDFDTLPDGIEEFVVELEINISSKVGNVTSNPNAGSVSKGTNVTLSTTTAEARIYYTLDGSDPTPDSIPYNTPIVINSAVTIKAVAIKDGLESSDITSFIYRVAPTTSSGGGDGGIIVYVVKFETDGGSKITGQRVIRNDKVTQPVVPSRDGFIFVGWYLDKGLTKEYNFDSAVTSDTIIYAKWVEDVEAQEPLVKWINPFIDVNISDWFYDAVQFIAQKGITQGISPTLYNPQGTVTRAQFITMLCRAYGIEERSGDNFSDARNTWYTGYLASVKQLGIADGIGDNMFAPDIEITREQMVTLIYNYFKIIGEESPGDWMIDLSYADKDKISDWAIEGVVFGTAKQWVKGKGENIFDPQGTATRAELAQIFYNIFMK